MSSVAQRVVYAGKQAVSGTGVTVDVALRAKATMKAVVDKIEVEEDIGSFAPSRHYIGSKHAEGSLEYDGYYEHAPIILSMALGVGYVNPGSPNVWTFDLPENAVSDFALYTMEYSDGVNHIVHGEDMFASELEISGEAGKTWMFKPTLMGGNVTFPAAVSASPTAPASVIPILMSNTKIYFDDTFETLGDTEHAQLISFTWKLSNLQHHKLFAGALYPTGHGNNKWEITLEVIVECENAVTETLKDRLFNTDQTFCRIQAVDTGVDALVANVDGAYYVQDVDTLDDRDGNNILKITLKGERPGSSYWYAGEAGGSILVESSLAAL